MLHPDAPREWGQRGAVSVEDLGRRLDPRPHSELEAEIEALLRRMLE